MCKSFWPVSKSGTYQKEFKTDPNSMDRATKSKKKT